MNYDGKYKGSSRHPLFKPGRLEILEILDDPTKLTAKEREWQEKYDILNDPDCFNLVYANEKFSSAGRKFYHDPVTLERRLFLEHQVLDGWVKGMRPLEKKKRKTYIKKENSMKKGSIELRNHLSNKSKESAKRGEEHKDTKQWILVDPYGNKHTVNGLYPFCEEHNLSPTAIQYSLQTQKPIKKGKSKGWYAVEKCNVASVAKCNVTKTPTYP